MKRTQRPDLRQEIKQVLAAQERFGVSKKEHGAQNGIYSFDTAKAYNRWAQDFAGYVMKHSPEGRYTPLSACLPYAKQYIEEKANDPRYSASTVKLQRSALAKTLGVDGRQLGEVASRKREDISRSRNHYVTSEKTGKTVLNQNVRAGHFSEKNNADIVAVAKGTGTRRHELANLKGSDFKVNEDGSMRVTITGKGGKTRTSEVIGDTQRIRALVEAAGDGRLFEKVPAKMDVHYYRAQYAQELYERYARQIESVPRAERYDCRGDMAGTSFDKKAMEIVSENLGHERIDVIAGNYLWK